MDPEIITTVGTLWLLQSCMASPPRTWIRTRSIECWIGWPPARRTCKHGWLPWAYRPTTRLRSLPPSSVILASTYVDGTTSPLAQSGYSRDHRPDRTQMVIGLLITDTGYPIDWQVWPGNTPDVTTVRTVVKDLRQRLKLGPCILVFDRGMVSEANLEAIAADHHTYLSALNRDELPGLPFWATTWPETVPDADWQTVLTQGGLQAY